MPEEEERISIILCVRNAKKKLGNVFECLFASSLKGYEVVVVDDASSDDTVDICESFGISPIRLEENIGPAAARNLAVQHSQGDILLFLDSDVVFAPDVLEKMITRLKADPALAGVGTLSSPEPLNSTFYAKYFALQEYLWTHRALLRKEGPKNSYICTRCGCLRRKVFEEMGGFNEQYKKPSTEDLEFSARMGDRYLIAYYEDIENMHYFPDVLSKIFYRYHQNTREIVQMPKWVRKKAAAPYRNDAIARLLICFSGLFLVIALFSPWCFLGAAFLLASAAMLQREFLYACYTREGLRFALKSWALYCVLPIPVATGVIAGTLGKITQPAAPTS